MRDRLQIGELAKLAGVTTKTLRHYHKLGLLAEPPRTEAGYRLYGASDLLRLQRIRRMQQVGLSLAQIRFVLGNPDEERSLWGVLGGLLEEVEAQIAELEARRTLIQRLLAEENLDALERSTDSLPTIRLLEEKLGHLLAEIPPDLWEQEKAIWSVLDGFHWPQSYQEDLQVSVQAAIQFATDHPDQYRALLAQAAAFAALAHVPEASEEVERVADLFAQSPIVHHFEQEMPPATPMPAPFADVLGDLLSTQLSPAQRRLITILEQRFGQSLGARSQWSDER